MNGGAPKISVFTTPHGRSILEVRLETASFVVQNTASQVAQAVNGHPEASLCISASPVLDGSASAAFGRSIDAWQIRPNGWVAAAAGSSVRAIAEIVIPEGAQFLSLNLIRQTPASNSLRSISSLGTINSLPLPGGSIILTTPWYDVAEGDSNFSAAVFFGGELGLYRLGRCGVQIAPAAP
jgi:hypothetical protein